MPHGCPVEFFDLARVKEVAHDINVDEQVGECNHNCHCRLVVVHMLYEDPQTSVQLLEQIDCRTETHFFGDNLLSDVLFNGLGRLKPGPGRQTIIAKQFAIVNYKAPACQWPESTSNIASQIES